MSSFSELAMVSKYRRPSHRRMLSLTVLSRERLSPHFMSVTIGGEDLADLEQSGFEQNGRLFFAGPDQPDVVFPTSDRWMMQYARQSAATRPRVRFYSIRRFRPEVNELDLEIVIHQSADGAGTPGSSWALSTQPGEEIRFLDEGRVYGPTPGATWQLLVGDESALPPILAILEQSAHELPSEAFLEVPTSEDVRDDITVGSGTTLHWLPRNDPSRKPGTLALEAVKAAQLPPGRFYTWTAGEAALPTGVRRHLVDDRGVLRSDIAFSGYWRQGKASLG